MNRFRISHRVIFGIFIIFVGIILLLNSLDLVDADISFSMYWPIILIVLGLTKIINFDESTFAGGILLLVGSYFQLKNLNVEFIQDIKIATVFWPIVVILFGLSMLFESRDKKHVTDDEHLKSNDMM